MDKMNNWIASKNVHLPDFIIYGAMKSGTSTLHYILNQHPHVDIPKGEIGFFDIDNILQHPAYNTFDGTNWSFQDLELDPEYYWRWYESRFTGCSTHNVVGEDSTTYLASDIAAKRLSLQDKNIKIIILLRQPTFRSYSHYWHLVRTGRAKYDFEKTILHEPWSVINRSLYYEQLNKLLHYISKRNVKILLFEDFINNKRQVLYDICTFLGIDYNFLPDYALSAHKNQTMIHKFPSLQLLKTRLFPESSKKKIRHLPYNASTYEFKFSKYVNMIHWFHKKVNPAVLKEIPDINKNTKKYLDNYFKKELHGINDLLHRDVMSLWFD